MEGGDGMVAVVRGIRDAGLAVTLLDGTRQYTLLPNPARQQAPTHMHIAHMDGKSQRCAASNTGCDREVITHCDSTAQATDGHYASMYKMAHCNVTPTAPPVEVTEFPPQRAELSRGHGNFEVGGFGSGECYSPIRPTGAFKGGMSWPDRGSVCAPRPSHEPDAFANSLRRYPTLSPDRSEVVERLISYTQARNSSKTYQTRTQTSPNRLPVDPPNHHVDRCPRTSVRRSYEHEFNARTRPRVDEFPTRDWKPKKDGDYSEYKRSEFTKNYDVRYLREVSRRFKDTLRISSQYNHPVCPIIKERSDHLPLVTKPLPEQTSTNSVDMETQAAVEMISREASTVPRIEPPKRTIAVPLSPTSSTAVQDTEGEHLETTYKSVYTSFSPLDLNKSLKRLKSVQTCSSIDLVNAERIENDRRSKSQEELSTNGLESEIVRLLEEVEFCSDLSSKDKILREGLLNRFNKNNFRESFKHSLKSWSSYYQYYVRCRKDFSETQKEGRFKKDISFCRSDFLDSIINDWVTDMPIKDRDFLGRQLDIKNVKNTVANKLKYFMLHYEGNRLKSKIFEYIDEIPIDIDSENKSACLNRHIDALLKKVKFGYNKNRRKKTFKFKKHVQPTESELREYIRQELYNFCNKCHIKINVKCLEELELHLVDVLIDSLDYLNSSEDLRDDVVNLLVELGHLDYHQAVNYTDMLISNLKEIFGVDDNDKKENMYIVLQSTCPNSSRQPNLNESSDFSISRLNTGDLEANLDFYMNQLTNQIDEWLTNLGISEEDKNFREVVVNDLASDIVDRHKFLELNPSSQVTDEEELEHLKYQIFKWINKLVGEENTNTIDHASDLMKRIQSISAPMLTKPGQSNNNILPACCQPKGPKSHAKGGFNSSQVGQSSQGYSVQGIIQQRGMCSENKDFNQMPMLGTPGVGESMIESYSRPGSPSRMHSGPGVCNADQMRSDYNNMNVSKMQMFGPSEKRLSNPGNFSQGYRKTEYDPCLGNINIDRQMGPVVRTISSSQKVCGADRIIPETNICDGGYNMNLNQMPVFGPAGPGGSMSEAARSQEIVYQRRMSAPGMYGCGHKHMGSCGMSNSIIGSNQYAGPSSVQSSRKPACCQGVENAGQTDKDQRTGSSGATRSQVASSCCPSQHHLFKPPLQQLEKDFEAYLRQWVQKIPLSVENPEDLIQFQELLISNVYKIIAVVKCNSEVLNNSALYQDLLEEQIDALFEEIPKSPEFIVKQHVLKTELLERIVDIEKDILKSIQTSSYRGQLIDNMKNHMPGASKMYDKNDYYSESNDVIERGNIADNFVLQMYFKDDKIKSNVYRTKVAKSIYDMVGEIGRSQKLPINLDATVNSLIGALHSVPLPPEEELKVEANQILLAHEVDQWLIDLPIPEPDKSIAASQRRKLREGIVRKIYEIESKNVDNCVVERELKQEVLKAIERVPMSSKEDVNINFMVEELVNRLKNRPKEIPRRKSVSFNESLNNFEDFGRSGILCSTYKDNLNESYYMADGVRRELPYSPLGQPELSRGPLPQGAGQIGQPYYGIEEIPSDEFYTMDESGVPARQRQAYSQAMTNQNVIFAQGRCGNTSLAPQIPAQSSLNSCSPGRAQQISCGRPMSQNQQGRAIHNQSTYVPISQGLCGNISQAHKIIAQPFPPPDSSGITQQMPCEQPMLPSQQGRAIRNQSAYAGTMQGPCGNMSQAQQVSALPCALSENPGIAQQIPYGQPMLLSQQDRAMFNQSAYAPMTQGTCGDVSQAQQISAQPCAPPDNPRIAQQMLHGQPMLSSQQNQRMPNQSLHVPLAQDQPGYLSQAQQLLSQHSLPLGSPGRTQPITCGQPVSSHQQGQFNGVVPVEPVCGFPFPQRSPVQQTAQAPCDSIRAQPNFQHQAGPAPGPINCGSVMQVQQLIPAAGTGLQTSQTASSSGMVPGQSSQGPYGSQPSSIVPSQVPLTTRSVVTQSNLKPAFGLDLRPQNPTDVQITGNQVTASGFSTSPVANSTPQNQIRTDAVPPRMAKKRTREVDRIRLDNAARRLDLEMSDEDDEDDEEECRCVEKLRKSRRRRPMYFSCEDYDDYPGCPHMIYPFPWFF